MKDDNYSILLNIYMFSEFKATYLNKYTFLKTLLEFFFFFYFTPGSSKQNKAQPLNIPQSCVRSLGNSKAKNKYPWKFHIIFTWSPLEVPLCF